MIVSPPAWGNLLNQFSFYLRSGDVSKTRMSRPDGKQGLKTGTCTKGTLYAFIFRLLFSDKTSNEDSSDTRRGDFFRAFGRLRPVLSEGENTLFSV